MATPEIQLTREQQSLIARWAKAKTAAAAAVELERELRAQVASEIFDLGEGELREGTETRLLGAGYKIKGTFSINHSLGKADDVRAVLESLDERDARDLVRWEPKLSLTAYKKAPEEVRVAIQHVLTCKPSMPSIELVEPKGKAK